MLLRATDSQAGALAVFFYNISCYQEEGVRRRQKVFNLLITKLPTDFLHKQTPLGQPSKGSFYILFLICANRSLTGQLLALLVANLAKEEQRNRSWADMRTRA